MASKTGKGAKARAGAMAGAGAKVTAALRASVLRANKEIATRGLARFTFGNASAIDRARGRVVIKPSGVPYERLKAGDLVVTDLKGRVLEGTLRPSSDLATHLELYRRWPRIGGIVHTHSHFATVWAQARQSIPCYGTTHADHFDGPVLCTRDLTAEEIAGEYELNTGRVIVERFEGEPHATGAVLVAGHASFVWAPSVEAALETADVLEEVARMAYHTAVLHPAAEAIPAELLAKHFSRKHGATAYYGQRN